MNDQTSENLNTTSDTIANIIENLACRIAELKSGIVSANDLIPYLPLSWSIIDNTLKNMIDGISVISDTKAGFPVYKFISIEKRGLVNGKVTLNSCVGCDKDLKHKGHDLICEECRKTINNELEKLAKQIAWPAEAVYEHEIIYLASKLGTPISPAILAGHSRYTLRNMRRKLQHLQEKGALHIQDNLHTGAESIIFPEVDYPRNMYKRNISVICSFPASLQEEVEMRIVKIIYTLAILGIFVFTSAILLGLPFPIMITSFAILAPITAIYIWKHKTLPADI